MSRDDHLCWFHGKLSRENAEELLDGKENGTFLIRESNTATGDFVLTLLHEGEVCHYQIRRHGEDAFFSIDDKVKILHGLDTLVEFYQQSANGLVTKLSACVKKDPPPNDSRSHGVTNLLHRATKENNHCVVSELLKCGYRNVDAKNQDGQTAMHLASLYCDEKILQLLLDAGVNINCMDTLGNMPLHYACRGKSGSFIRMLLKGNANVQGRNIKNGYVPLHEASKYGNLEAIKELLNAYAPLLPRTSFGEFPIDLAKEAGHEEVVSYLSGYKLPISSTNKKNWYHGTLSREEAIETLMTYAAKMKEDAEKQETNNISGQDAMTGIEEVVVEAQTSAKSAIEIDTSGCFLVRYSERKSAGSGYVLTLLWNKNAKNFIISQSSNFLYIDDGPYLPSLEHLVEHFMRFSDGLPVSLKHPVLPKPKPPLPQFSTMPRIAHKKLNDNSFVSTTVDENATVTDNNSRKFSLNDNKIEVGEKQSQTLKISSKKKHREMSGSVLNTIITNTLRKTKHKLKPNTETELTRSAEDDLKKTESVLKNLTFSTEFSTLHQTALEDSTCKPSTPSTCANLSEDFYNVPKNNAAISQKLSDTNDACALDLSEIEIEKKTEDEIEYFTKSDMAIERERESQFEKSNIQHDTNSPATYSPNANGYLPTVDIRVFLDRSGMNQNLTWETEAAELREISKNPERLDSLISNVSNESEITRYLNRQNSNVSSNIQCLDPQSQIKKNYFIPQECLQLISIIGSGEFGNVYKGCLSTSSIDKISDSDVRCEVAIKTLLDEHCRKNKQEFLREASVMIRLHHHCIVQLIGISKGETLMMVQELVPLGSMLDFIHKEKCYLKYELKIWASQIACGMQYLESHHFVHRDLAARNILLASRNQAKISDFGLSRALGLGNDCYQATQGGKWPIKWYAPESFNNGLFSHASDVWSFGVTLWEMFSHGESPYGDIPGVDVISLIESGERLSKPHPCPNHIYEIMKNCWNYKPKDRPTFRYLTDFFARDPDYQNIVEMVKTEHIS